MHTVRHINAGSSRNPSRMAIRNLSSEIRDHWTIGERHHRARLALLLQYRLIRFQIAANECRRVS